MNYWNNTIFCTLFQSILDNFSLNNNQIAIAVSGGIDSIVLLHLIANWAKKKHHPLPIALTVDHKLRPESKQEADFVVNYAKKFELESFILNLEKQEIKGNVQLQAREVRYRLLTEWCKNNNIRYLFVAHHKDDQAETFLLRLERGSGIDGLSSMNHKSFLNGVCILRPLLDFSRSNIEKYANFHQLKWVEDRSNTDLKYRRTLYRNLLKVSDNQEILTKRICLTALHMQRATKALIYYTRLAFNDCVNIHELGYIEIKLSEFHQLPEEIALRLLLYSIMAIRSKHYKPRYNSLIFIFNKILQEGDNVNHTLSGCKIKKYEESILIIRESLKIKEVSVNLPTSESIQWDNRFTCTILGDDDGPVGITTLKNTQKIPEFLENYNCCPEVFYSLPVIQKDEKILAYPHINHNEKNISSDKVKFVITCIIKENLDLLQNRPLRDTEDSCF